jgi:glycosyltransferase involved in cell wall biosynthesis
MILWLIPRRPAADSSAVADTLKGGTEALQTAIVNLFDPLPGEAQQQALREGRYVALCRALVAAGHQVHWYSSDFSHAIKRPRDAAAVAAAARQAGYTVTLAPSRPYAGNVSPARLASHRGTTRRLADIWSRDGGRPDAIIVSLPPPALARAAADWAARSGAKLIVDIQDLWPETFGRFWPRGLGWMNRVVFGGMIRDAAAACRAADAVIGVARGYTDFGLARARPGTPSATLHLGVDLAAFDSAVRPLAEFGLSKPAGERWLFIAGSFGAYVDVDAALCLMEELRRRGRTDVRLMAAGGGVREPYFRQEAARRGLGSITFLGRKPDATFMSLEAAADVALLPLKAESYVFFPNRVFDFFAAGLPVVSTVAGELADVLTEHGAGVTCSASDPAALADAVERFLGVGSTRPPRGAWVKQYDRRRIAEEMVRVLESTAGVTA